MKYSFIVPVILSVLFGIFMTAGTGFVPLIKMAVESMDYSLVWSITPIDVVPVALMPWIAWILLRTKEKRTLISQLGLNLAFIAGGLVFFVFGFLMISIAPNDNPLLPAYLKVQPFQCYWSIWFALGDLLIVVFFLLNKRQREAIEG